MKPVLITLCVFIAGQAAAQKFSAGLRGGINRWSNTAGAVLDKPNNSIQFTKAIYVRYESKKRFAVEFETDHYLPDFSNWQWRSKYGDITHEVIEERYNDKTFEYNLGAQVRLNRLAGKIDNYIGSLVSLHYHYSYHSLTARHLITKEISKSSSTIIMGQTMFGLNHYLSYDLNKHFNVHSQLALKFDIINNIERTIAYPDNQLTWTIGCGYTF